MILDKRERQDETGSVYLALQDHLDHRGLSSTSRISYSTIQTVPSTTQGFLKLRDLLVQRVTWGYQESADLQVLKVKEVSRGS